MALSITVTNRSINNGMPQKKIVYGTMLTNNTTYAAGGLALPAKEQFGFVRQMDSFKITGEDTASATQYLLSWDKSTNKLQFFVSHDTAGVTALPLDEEGADAVGTRTYTYEATGW